MKIDINEIVTGKLKEMEEGKVLEQLIVSEVEKAVTGAVKSAIDSYSIKRILEDKLEADVKSAVSNVGFTAYNQIMVNKMEELMQSVVKDDLADKVAKLFEKIMINKRETIKLSEIIKEYRELYADMDYDEIQELDDGSFYVKFEDSEDGSFRHIDLILAQDQQEERKGIFTNYTKGSDDKKLELRMMIYGNKETASISSVEFEGKNLKELSTLRRMSDFEALMINLFLNETKVIIDIEDEDDIDNYVGYDD